MAHQSSHYNQYALPGPQHSSQLAIGAQTYSAHYHQPTPEPFPPHQTSPASTSTPLIPQYNAQTTQSLPFHLHPPSNHQSNNLSSPSPGPYSSATTSTSASPAPHSMANTCPPGQAQHPQQGSSLMTPDEDLVLSMLWVDNLSKDMKLEPSQREQMRDFIRLASLADDLGCRMSKADAATRLYSLGVALGEIAERRRGDAMNAHVATDVNAVYTDLRTRLEITFDFTKPQNKNMRVCARDTMFDPDRPGGMKTVDSDVKKRLRDDSANNLLDNVFGVPSREEQLDSLLAKICSSLRNALRVEILNSIFGSPDQRKDLSSFSFHIADKYKRGGVSTGIPLKHTIRMAIMRQFAMDHRDVIGAAENVPEDGQTQADSAPLRKRKRGGGRVPESEDFWKQYDDWFAKEVAERGADLSSPAWREFINKSIVHINGSKDSLSIPGSTGSPTAAPTSEMAAETSQAPSVFSGAGSRNILAGI